MHIVIGVIAFLVFAGGAWGLWRLFQSESGSKPPFGGGGTSPSKQPNKK